jgi:hypothetical protein
MAFLQWRNSLMFGRGTQSICGKVRRCGGEGQITLIHMCIRRMKCRMAQQGEREQGNEKTYPNAYGVHLVPCRVWGRYQTFHQEIHTKLISTGQR